MKFIVLYLASLTAAHPGKNASPPPVPRMNGVWYSCINPGTFALTFDDGPSKNVPALLNKLDQLGVKATFFVNANNYAQFDNPNSVDAQNIKRIYQRGHQIGTHTYSHQDLTVLSASQVKAELTKNDDAIKRIIGTRPTHLRPPFLATSPAMVNLVTSLGYKILNINIDTKDYRHNNLWNENALNHQEVDYIVASSNPQQDSFISLQHDFTTKTIQFVDEYVRQVRAKGYRFVTTGECIGDPIPYR
jgi:peptidoglycan/xylan/chitin deacetylase (PgdA/CDA1 family)